jgi:DsbC/DsbD-like thiol-disulfide interchange protein
MKPFRVFLAALLPLLLPGAAQSAPSSANPQVKIKLISEQTSLKPGGKALLGLYFRMEKGWHIYWSNPGDSGQAPSVSWKLPYGFSVGEIQWPLPKKLPLPSLMDYGYENEVLLMVTLKVPSRLDATKPVKLAAKVRWLACKEVCIPGSAEVILELPVNAKTPGFDRRWKELFAQTGETVPLPLPKGWKAEGTEDANEFVLTFKTPGKNPVTQAWFFPSEPNEVEHAANQVFRSQDSSFQLVLKRSDQLMDDLPVLEGVLAVKEKGQKKPLAYQVKILIKF